VLPYPDPEQTQYMAPVTHPDGPDPATGAPAGAVRDGQGAEEPPATRLGGPLFRDEYPAPPVGTDAEQTAVLPPIPGTPPPPSSPPPPVAPAQPAPAKPRAGRNLRAAIGVGVALGAAVLLSLFFVKALFVVVVSGAVVVGLWELTSRLAERKEISVPLVPVALGGVAMEVAAYLRGPEGVVIAFALTAFTVLVWRMSQPPENYLRDVTAGIFTALYVPFLATFVVLMLRAHDGPQRALLFLLLTVCSDTGAYAVGARFGRVKLAPTISPGKTREGLVGAVGLAMLVGALGMQYMIDKGTWWQGLILGTCVALSATLGDLGESMIKRDLGIKDMGTLLPGHGGLMDRLDSLLPTAPVVWLVFAGLVGTG
jgi:phosphatidate cytidylyltransferase